MEWYYSENGQQKGPASQEAFDALVRSGVVDGTTLVWREGFSQWRPYSNAAGTAQGFSGANGDVAMCSECGRRFPKNETVQFEDSIVCAGCKPLFLQKLREGVALGPTGAIYRSGRQLVTLLDVTLPRRCIRCNFATEGDPIKRKLYWHSPFVYLTLVLLSLGFIFYIIIAILLRKRGVVFLSICALHRARRRNVILVAWLVSIGGFIAMIAGFAHDVTWIGVTSGVIMLGGVIYGAVRGRLVFPKKIDREHMWLGGCGEEFLASFPEWTGPK